MTTKKIDQNDPWLQYKLLGNELRNRTLGPLRHVQFVVYFLIAMVLVGPISVWIEVFRIYILDSASAVPTGATQTAMSTATAASIAPLRTALLTFFPAVAATAALQLVLADQSSQIRAIAMLCFVGILTLAVFMVPNQISDTRAMMVGALATLIAYWLSWIANARNSDLLGKIDPSDPIGGNNATASLKGSLDGYNA